DLIAVAVDDQVQQPIGDVWVGGLAAGGLGVPLERVGGTAELFLNTVGQEDPETGRQVATARLQGRQVGVDPDVGVGRRLPLLETVIRVVGVVVAVVVVDADIGGRRDQPSGRGRGVAPQPGVLPESRG